MEAMFVISDFASNSHWANGRSTFSGHTSNFSLTRCWNCTGFKTLALLLEQSYYVCATTQNAAGFEKIAVLKRIAPFRSQLSNQIMPDITVEGAYDEAVQGVNLTIYVASPIPGVFSGNDYERWMIEPAVQGTVGMLESAANVTGIRRIVITAPYLSVADLYYTGPIDG
ncbi:hypothetical protein ACHAPJ_008521 [Fusarium lateritium]